MPPSDVTTQARHVGRYLLQDEVGRGGMGVVYAALDEVQGRRVALKLLRPGTAEADAVVGERFEREMQIAISLEHPNIVPVHEIGMEDGVRFIAMRLVDGEDLGAVLRREGGLAPSRVARLGRQIASALDAAHATGLVHRDVKPGNVLLTGSGDEEHAYLTDFGLTRDAEDGITQTGQWIGTVDYAAPEQIEAAPLSARTDVYALGCVFFHMLTGQLPFRGSFAAKASAHATAPLPSVGLAGPLGEQVDKVLAIATAKDPARRHASAGALARALARIIATEAGVTQQTMAMPAVLPEDDVPPTAALPAEDATAVASREPRAAAVPAAEPAPEPRRRARAAPLAGAVVGAGAAGVPDGVDAGDARAAGTRPRQADQASPLHAPADGGRRSPWLVPAGILAALLAIAAVVALAAGGGGGSGTPSSRLSASGAAKPGSSSTAKRGSAASKGASSTAAKPASPAPAVPAPQTIPTAAYTAPAGGYSARVPAGDGWANQGEKNLSGVIRTVFTGPDGQQLWIDATPTMAPAFGRNNRTVTQEGSIDGPLGTIRSYRFTGEPAEFCAGGCVDYQLDLGGHGFAVVAGPSSSARLAARRAITSLQPAAAAAAPAAGPGPGPAPAPDAQPGKGKGKKGR